MQPDDPLIWAEIEQFCEVQVLAIRRVVATRLRLHSAPFYAQEVQTAWLRNPSRAALLSQHNAEKPAHSLEHALVQRGGFKPTAGFKRAIPGFHDGGSLAGNESART